MSDSEEEDYDIEGIGISDPLTGAFMDERQPLLNYHRTHTQAMMLWKTHVDNVEPIHRVLHIPTTAKMVEIVTLQPELALKADECLLFAIYHCAMFSMTETACMEKMGQSRATLLQTYNFAARQALVNASFLKSTKMSIMQALTLFLIACRHMYDLRVFWILTGVAVRIAKRMGLHQDGENQGLSPFDVQMRCRLFYQLIALDGGASRMTGTGMGMMPDSCDTKLPLNLNDDEIWPGMTVMPAEQKGATEMIFCLARACIGRFFVKAGVGPPFAQLKETDAVELIINEAENEVEHKYIRYCGVVSPLHSLTMVSARSSITTMRMRNRLPKARWRTATEAETKEMFGFSQKILDTNIAACAHTSLRKFQWDTSLRKPELFSATEIDAPWRRVEQIYHNHRKELLESKRAPHLAIGRLALKAWAATAPSGDPEPAFMLKLRSSSRVNLRCRAKDSSASATKATTDTGSPVGPPFANEPTVLFDGLSGGKGADIYNDTSLGEADWMFWDQLIQDYQSNGD